MFNRLAIVLLVVSLAATLSWITRTPSHAEAAYACSGKQVYPSQNLAKVAAGTGAGTTFCLNDGTYRIPKPVRAKDGDKFIGVYGDSTRPSVVTDCAQVQVFNVTGSEDVTIKGLKRSGAVGGDYCELGCGNGIRGGTNLTVENAWITNNKNNGIGGAGASLLVKSSVIDHNGSRSFTDSRGPVSSAGIKSTRSLTVLNSRIYDNYWNGVWCDEECRASTVKNSVLTGNGKAAIHDEISSGPAVFSGNTIKGNGTLNRANQQAGILIVSSAHVDAHNNTFGSNVGPGVQIIEDRRKPRVRNVKVYDNTMNLDAISGCRLRGVSCYGN